MSDQAKIPTNFAQKLVGNLAADAAILDRTCPNCKGIYHSLSTPACPKCNAALTYITTGEGKPMSITEFTFYPIFGKETRERWEKDTSKRKGGCGITWRCKIFNYADSNGVLGDHPLTMQLKKGARIEIKVFNHPPYATGFISKKHNMPMIELLYVLYPKYGDTIKVLTKPANIVQKVDAQGAPVQPVQPYGVTTPTNNSVSPELINAITAQVIASLQGKAPVQPAAPVKTNTPPATTVAATATTEEDLIGAQLMGDLYGDMDADIAEASMPDLDTASMAAVNPWK